MVISYFVLVLVQLTFPDCRLLFRAIAKRWNAYSNGAVSLWSMPFDGSVNSDKFIGLWFAQRTEHLVGQAYVFKGRNVYRRFFLEFW